MKKYIFIFLVVIISGCNNSNKVEVAHKKVVKKELRPFFDSDKIDHYYLNLSDDDFTNLIHNDKPTHKQEELTDIYVHHFPDTIPKENFEKILLTHNYKKSNLSIIQQKEIENVFSEKDSLQNSFASCAAEYRDIFIFKKKEKTVGIAKICFKCGRFQIIGSKLDTSGFGLWSELDELQTIIKSDKKS